MDARIIVAADLTTQEICLWREFQMANRCYHSPFFSPEFARAIGKARNDARVAVLSRNGRVCGFLPFHRNTSGVAKPIGGPISDYQGPILVPGVEVDRVTLLRACGLKAYDFNHAPASLATLRSGAIHFSQSPHIDLADGYASYVANRPKAGKNAVKDTDRRIRKVERELGPIKFVWHDTSTDALRGTVAMKNAAYARLGVPSAFGVPWVRHALAAILAEQGRDFSGLLSTVYVGERMIAANLGMRSATTVCWWFNTYEFELRHLSPGLILLLKAAQRMSEEGLLMIDFGRGDEHYKLTFANGSTQLCEGSIEVPKSIPGALRQFQKLGVRSFARMPLGRFESWPRRAFGRIVTSMRLPDEVT